MEARLQPYGLDDGRIIFEAQKKVKFYITGRARGKALCSNERQKQALAVNAFDG